MTHALPILVLRNGVPVKLDPCIEDMIRALVESQAQITQHQSGCVELHFGLSGTQAFLREKLGKWKT
jgi:hypothetical protein